MSGEVKKIEENVCFYSSDINEKHFILFISLLNLTSPRHHPISFHYVWSERMWKKINK